MIKFIDLFCGIGGFHEAMRSIPNSKCVFACDIDKACCKTYERNFNIKPVSNVKDIEPSQLEDFDILCAGFP